MKEKIKEKDKLHEGLEWIAKHGRIGSIEEWILDNYVPMTEKELSEFEHIMKTSKQYEQKIKEMEKENKQLKPFKKYLNKDIYILTPKEWKQVEQLKKFYITTVKQFKELETLLQAKVQ